MCEFKTKNFRVWKLVYFCCHMNYISVHFNYIYQNKGLLRWHLVKREKCLLKNFTASLLYEDKKKWKDTVFGFCCFLIRRDESKKSVTQFWNDTFSVFVTETVGKGNAITVTKVFDGFYFNSLTLVCWCVCRRGWRIVLTIIISHQS